MFHKGHLNLLRNAKKQCDYLVVGVNSDALVKSYKDKTPIISELDRAEIIKELRCVDKVIICDTLKKLDTWNIIHFNAIFIGDDWKENARWQQTEKDLACVGAEVVYLKYTYGISSTFLRSVEVNRVKE
ncbi:MAG: adenylyltransferase/cytidyltransferase family protein [Paludibacteraceae bacterium]|nr:adenylyltransferase/cytidyltransferase family protein [Paludibacteraceae bacterium]